jgi:hypothetical protein
MPEIPPLSGQRFTKANPDSADIPIIIQLHYPFFNISK